MTAEPADKLLVVGADGLLGSTLMNLAREQGQPALGTALAPAPGSNLVPLDLDALTDEWTPPPGCRAAVLCAAITSLDACRRNPTATRRINVEQTLRLARRLSERGIFVTFISSNLVFDGSASRVPADAPTRPQTEYGRQKAEVEAGLAVLGAPAAVVRLTKVMHSGWALFQGWIDSLRQGRAIQPFADFVCAPIPLSLVARGLADIARGRRAGIWQFSAEADVSYADIARHLASRLGARGELVQPGRSTAHATLEHNPAHTTLDATRAREQLGLTFPPPMEAIHQAFRAGTFPAPAPMPTSLATPTCHLCGSPDLELSAAYAGFHRVTSDCKPWPAGGQFARCRGCGLVQTLVTPEWSAEADRIYAGYTIYHQSGGSEQRVFDGRGGSAGQPRSRKIIGALRRTVDLPARGRLLDLGCGNGSFLSAWSELVPGWTLAGSEVSEKYKTEVESIPGVERLHTGDLGGIPGTFDAISLIHVLEHIPSPAAFLRRLRPKLNPGGLLILEVPDCAENPYILLVADHCSHFSPGLLGGVAQSAGFDVLTATHDWVAKEVSVVARRPADEIDTRPLALPVAESRRVFENSRALDATLAAVRPLTHLPDFGLFGTAIAATWLDSQTGGAARFFVDEDINRTGRRHLDRPILAPTDIPRGATVFVGLPPILSGPISERLRALNRDLRIHLPPA